MLGYCSVVSTEMNLRESKLFRRDSLVGFFCFGLVLYSPNVKGVVTGVTEKTFEANSISNLSYTNKEKNCFYELFFYVFRIYFDTN